MSDLDRRRGRALQSASAASEPDSKGLLTAEPAGPSGVIGARWASSLVNPTQGVVVHQ
jgi:hypothetical protein